MFHSQMPDLQDTLHPSHFTCVQSPTPPMGIPPHPQCVKKVIVSGPTSRHDSRSLDLRGTDRFRAVLKEKNGWFEPTLRMFRITKLIAIISLSAAPALSVAGLSKIDALGMIESGNNDAAIGTSGEISRYQIKPYIWRGYSASRSWRDARVAAVVAQDYLTDLEQTFRKRAQREPTDFDLYVLWNAGPAYYSKVGFAPDRVHRVIRERAGRFVNLREMKVATANPLKPLPVALPEGTQGTRMREMTSGQLMVAPLPPLDSNALAPSIPGLALMPMDSRIIAGGRGTSLFLSSGGMHTK